MCAQRWSHGDHFPPVVIDVLLTGMGFPLTRMICVFDITFSP